MTHFSMHGRGGNRWRMAIWGAAAGLLMVPAVAMQFTAEVAWSPMDFTVFAAMLVVACGAYEVAAWLSPHRAYRAGAGLALMAAFLMVWINLAVGIIGSEDAPANLLYGGVLLVALAGAIVARFQARGLSLAMLATAGALALVAVVAVALGHPKAAILTVALAGPWLAAAALFRRAAREGVAD